MKHCDEELYTIHGDRNIYYTQDYLEANGFSVPKRWHDADNEKTARKCYGFTNKDTIKVCSANEAAVRYVYGSHLWFDTKEERDAYRAEANAEYAEMVATNKVKKAIMAKLEGLTKEQLLLILESL